MRQAKMHQTRIDLDGETRQEMVALLNQELVDLFDLYSQAKQAHWNVKGTQFLSLHELYDQLAGQLLGHVDTVAERATTLGGTALGTARMTAAGSRLPEFPEVTDGRGTIEALVERYAALAASTRAGIEQADAAGDANTADLLTGVSRDLDKSLWILESHLV